MLTTDSKFRVAAVTGFLALGLSLAGCTAPVHGPGQAASTVASSSNGTTENSATVPSRTAGSSAVVDGTSAGIDHVVIIVEENKPASSILGNSAAPFINKLADDYALATNYQAVSHPSLPNYLALTSGTNAGITDDCTPGSGCTARVPNIADEIGQSGRSWKMYAESMPAPCTADSSGSYAVKHNPFMYYPSVTGINASCTGMSFP